MSGLFSWFSNDSDTPEWDETESGPEFHFWRSEASRTSFFRREDCPCCSARGWVWVRSERSWA